MKINVIILRDIEEQEEPQNYTYDPHHMFSTMNKRDTIAMH